MSYKTEFNENDYNVPAFINDKTGWFDESWHNDTCPRFENPKHNICIWVECTEPSKRQEATDNIFIVQPVEEMSINTVLFQTDSEEQLAAFLIALEFSAILSSWLTAEQLKQAVELNQTEEYADACATHNYCDSNVAMAKAMEIVLDNQLLFEDGDFPIKGKHVDLFNAAWTIAKSNNFFLTLSTQTK